MTTTHRRDFLRGAASVGAAGALFTLPPAIREALAIAPHRRTGTIKDVEHVVILTQENRSFDHYFGTLRGVRGFGDRFPIPVPDAPGIERATVWFQANGRADGSPTVVTPFRIDSAQNFAYLRITGTPHSFPDAEHAWADGKMNEWPRFKNDHSLGFFAAADLPFQFALAEAFTICDAYHCSFQGGTNPNRLFLFTGTNDPLQQGNGPAVDNDYDNLDHDRAGGYTWITYSERLQAAGVSWQIYQNMADNFTDNPLAGFRRYRDAVEGRPGAPIALGERGLSTRDLDKLKDDVMNDALPAVSWIIATAEGSEHPGPSSPAQGADYTARVIDALTSNPAVWSKTVLFVNFDENDGFFDHVPPPAVPSYVTVDPDRPSVAAGESTVDTTGEYHEFLVPSPTDEARALQFKPYGLGPRVPMYVVSPWSKGGWVNSEVFDHTSVIRFLERRFGVVEPNISPWRRAVCGDLTSAFDFAEPDHRRFYEELPPTIDRADRARALAATSTPLTPGLAQLPVQDFGTRRSRALPYQLHVHAEARPGSLAIELAFVNAGRAGAVFHVYDVLHLDRVPRRYTVEADKRLVGRWDLERELGAYDLFVLGPAGFHRRFSGSVRPLRAMGDVAPEIRVMYDAVRGDVGIRMRNGGTGRCTFEVEANAYEKNGDETVRVGGKAEREQFWSLRQTARWYDFTVTVAELPGYLRRFAGRVENGRDGHSDPAMGGRARGRRD
jgi:phospholipase C